MAINRNTTFINDGAKKTSSNYASTPNKYQDIVNKVVGTNNGQPALGNGGTGNSPSSPNVNNPPNAGVTQSDTANKYKDIVAKLEPYAGPPYLPDGIDPIMQYHNDPILPDYIDLTPPDDTKPMPPVDTDMLLGIINNYKNSKNNGNDDTSKDNISKDDTSKDDVSKDSEEDDTTKDGTGNGDTTKDGTTKDDTTKDGTGNGTTPPPEDVVASIIAAASSSNGMTDTFLNNYLELIGTGVEKSGNLTQMIQDALAGATVADTGGTSLETAIAAINSALAGHEYQDYRIDQALKNIKSFDGYGGGQALSDFSNILYRNANKSDNYSDVIYDNTDFMKSTGLDLMEYIKGYNPLETDWGRGVLDYYGIRSGEASNAANAAGAGANGGNIDSYAAANAERQRLSTLGEGISALSGMTNSRFENLLNTFNSIGVNVNNLLDLEGKYNLPFMKDQLTEAGDLAESLYKTDADAIKEYNDDIIKLVEAGNVNAGNRGSATGVAGVASGLAGTMAQANVDAQKDKNDFVSSLINAEGELNLPALINLINGAGNIGANLYATDATTTANLYNYLASMYGGGVESSGTESTGSTPAAPNKSDVESYMSYMREKFPDLTDAELVTKLIEYVPEWKNSAGFLEWIASGLGADTTK